MVYLNDRSRLLQPSATLAMTAKAAERKRQGLAVYNLSVGEPDFGTPLPIRESAKRAIDEGFTFYTASGGIRELKQAIAAKFKRDQGVDYELSQITCSNGGKNILFNFFQLVLNPGDEVILADPTWLSYQVQIEWAGGVCSFVPTLAEEGFRLKADRIRALVTSKTKVLVLNSPSNPTGAIVEKAELEALAQLAREHGFLILSDDVYEFFYYTEQPPQHILKVAPDLKEQVVIVNSISKTYAMTGWRLGYAAGPEPIISKMEELQSQEASNPSSISQKAALAALEGSQNSVQTMREAFVRRRGKVAEALERAGVPFVLPDGAFYFMVDVSKGLKAGETDGDFCQRLLDEKGVALVPGSAFGAQGCGWVRLSFATKDETLEKALELILEMAK
jgi:aspartate aminotransferase